jgi:stage V sporulation protein AF
VKKLKEKQQTPIPNEVIRLEQYLEETAGLNKSFDFGVRKLQIHKKNIDIFYINGLCDTNFIIQLLEEFMRMDRSNQKMSDMKTSIYLHLVHQSVVEVKTIEEMLTSVLSGLIAIVIEGEPVALIVDVRSYPGRVPQEPDTEKVIRGSRDGYVENIIVNTALTRRRIRDPNLRFEMIKIGKRSKTDVAVAYIKDVANQEFIDIIKKELNTIEVDGIPMADKTLEEFILKQGYNPYPLVRYTERADVGATHLLEGHVLLFVDTSPAVMISPATFFHHVQHAEEYRQSPLVGTLIRWTRFMGILTSIFLLPLWYLFVLEPSLLPHFLSYVGPNKHSHIPVFVQLLIADLGTEFLRLAAIHTPTPLATAMGLVAAVLIGQIAVDVGLFVPEVILYVAVAAIGTYATPSYELSVANKIVRTYLLVCVAIFQVPGFVIGSTLYLLFLINIRALNTPYLWPLVPFYPKALFQILIRRSVPISNLRPSIVRTPNKEK